MEGFIDSGSSMTGQSLPPEESEYDQLRKKLADLEREEIFWKNRIKAAKNDQFNLILNFPDSLLELEIKGISMHQCKIRNYEFSPGIERKKNIFEEDRWPIQPITLREQWATIPKRPIRIKDISNMKNLADSLDFTPASNDTGDVSIVLICSGNLSIGISQPKKLRSENPVLARDISQTVVMPTESSVVDSAKFRELLKGDWIHLRITRLDAIAIYRALTEKSQLVIRL